MLAPDNEQKVEENAEESIEINFGFDPASVAAGAPYEHIVKIPRMGELPPILLEPNSIKKFERSHSLGREEVIARISKNNVSFENIRVIWVEERCEWVAIRETGWKDVSFQPYKVSYYDISAINQSLGDGVSEAFKAPKGLLGLDALRQTPPDRLEFLGKSSNQ
jgi:hypothetical protein